MLLADLVAASAEVSATSSRTHKVVCLGALLSRLDPDEVPVAVGFLTGVPRQGRIGIGWAAISKLTATPAPDPQLTLHDLDRAVDEVAAATGPGSGGRRRDILCGLLSRATGVEQDFVRRLFVGELRQGALEGVMADAVAKASGVAAPAVRRALMLDGDLGRVATLALTQGPDAVAAVGFRVGRPVLPMLASTAADVGSAVAEMGECSVEWKLDGIRIQVHVVGDDVRIYTRNLNDVTSRLPDVVAAARALGVTDAVLDGEAMSFGDEDRPAAFQHTMSRIGRSTAPAAGVSAVLFDVLHLDGRTLVDEPLRDRLAVLDELAPGLRVPGIRTSDPGEASRVQDESLTAGHEGVVVKDLSSPYIAGRRGKAWRKIKPVRTLDLVVIGVEWGSGRRRGWLSNLHLGARDPSGGFVMVGKTFKGLTDELLRWQTEQLLARETGREGHIVWVRPELVVEIGLDGVQTSTRYPGGVALRFARVRRYRPDKDPTDADTIETVRSLLP